MATPTTTYSAIRAQMVSTIEALTPSSITSKTFRVTDTESADFRDYADGYDGAVFREFEIEFVDSVERPMHDGEVIYTSATCELVVAYPHRWADYTHVETVGTRWNAEAMRAIALEDRRTLVRAVATSGGANYVSAEHAGLDAPVTIDAADDVSFLVVPIELIYWQEA